MFKNSLEMYVKKKKEGTVGLGVPALGLENLGKFLSRPQPQLFAISSVYHLLCQL